MTDPEKGYFYIGLVLGTPIGVLIGIVLGLVFGDDKPKNQ
jgi:hypothetical protein